MNEEMKNNMREMTKGDTFGMDKLDKSRELNSNMSIAPQSPDEYTQTIHTLGGK